MGQELQPVIQIHGDSVEKPHVHWNVEQPTLESQSDRFIKVDGTQRRFDAECKTPKTPHPVVEDVTPLAFDSTRSGHNERTSSARPARLNKSHKRRRQEPGKAQRIIWHLRCATALLWLMF